MHELPVKIQPADTTRRTRYEDTLTPAERKKLIIEHLTRIARRLTNPPPNNKETGDKP